MSVSNLDVCLAKLRTIPVECKDTNYFLAHMSDCEARDEDFNNLRECISALSDILKALASGDPLVDALTNILAKMRTVKSGDILIPEDYNNVVSALTTARDILNNMEQTYIAQIELIKRIQPYDINYITYIYTNVAMYASLLNLTTGYNISGSSFIDVKQFTTQFMEITYVSGTTSYLTYYYNTIY